jgi:G3E family GTPase
LSRVTDQTTSIPVNVITGFLGSGKTSLLRRLLASPALADTAVLVNEFGEVGLDHHLLQRLDDEIVLLQSGCLCCTIRGDLSTAMRKLYARREKGEVQPFRRLVVETTGLADPVPILSTVMAEPMLRYHFRLGNVVTTVDAVNGLLHLERQPESAKQAAVADRIVITKTDIAGESEIAELRRRLSRLNPAAPQLETAPNVLVHPDSLLTRDLYDLAGRAEEVRRWLAIESDRTVAGATQHQHDDVNRHDTQIHAFCLRFAQPLDWTAFGIWLTMLLHSHGTDVLRVKGMLNVGSGPGPVVVHGVQHLVHPPEHLPQWPDDDHSSRIVFIVRGLSREAIERSLNAFGRLGAPALEQV